MQLAISNAYDIFDVRTEASGISEAKVLIGNMCYIDTTLG